MAIDLTEKDHNRLDAMLGQILDWYKVGEVSRNAAIGAIAHVFAAAAKDNAGEVQSWLHDADVLRRWHEGIKER
jgi:hypothetical protein